METQNTVQTISESIGWILFTLRLSSRRRRPPSTTPHPTINPSDCLSNGQLLLPGVAEPHRWDLGTYSCRRPTP